MNSEQHQPPKILVRNPQFDPQAQEPEFEKFDDPGAALARAHVLATENPSEFIDIYQHATAVRSAPNVPAVAPENDDADT